MFSAPMVLQLSPQSSLVAWRGWKAYLVRVYEIHVVQLAGHFYGLRARFLFRLCRERQQELVGELAVQFLKVWSERYGRLRSHEIVTLAASRFRKFREIILSPVCSEVAVPEVPGAWSIDRVNHNAVALSVLNSRIYIRIVNGATINVVDARGDHEDFATSCSRVRMPPFDKVRQRKIGASSRAVKTKRQANRFGSGRVILREFLSHSDRTILHIANSDECSRRLLSNEGPNLIQLGTQTESSSIVNKDCQRKRSLVSLCRDPTRDGPPVVSLI